MASPRDLLCLELVHPPFLGLSSPCIDTLSTTESPSMARNLTYTNKLVVVYYYSLQRSHECRYTIKIHMASNCYALLYLSGYDELPLYDQFVHIIT